MWERKVNRNLGKLEFDLKGRFKNYPDDNFKQLQASEIIKELGILKTWKIPSIGDLLTSSFCNSFFEDSRYNISRMFERLAALWTDFIDLKRSTEKSFMYLLKETDILTSDLKEVQATATTSIMNKIHYNSFSRPIDSQYIVPDNKFLLEDPKTNTIFNNSYSMREIQGAGLILPLKESQRLPLISVTRDLSNSRIGHLIIEENNPQNILEGRSYKFIFLDRDRDSLGNVYKRRSNHGVSLWFEFGGIQPVNRLQVSTLASTKISSIVYLDQNENQTSVDYSTTYGNGQLTILLDTIIAKAIKIEFVVPAPSDTTNHNNEQGRVYSILIKDFRAYYDRFETTGYFISQPIKIDNLVGCRIRADKDLIGSDYLLEFYLKIESFGTSRKLLRTDTIPILERYGSSQRFALYFLNKKTSLLFYPDTSVNGDALTLYEDDNLLTAGDDYFFYTDRDSTLSSSVPDTNSFDTSILHIELATFKSTARYSCIYTPRIIRQNRNQPGHERATRSLPINRFKGKSLVYLMAILRLRKSDPVDYPVLTAYQLELYTSSNDK